MRDLFAETSGPCVVCGEHLCAHDLIPEFRVTHASERYEREHVIAPEHIWSEPDENGGGRLLIAKGDPVDPVTAARYGWKVPMRGPGLPAKPPRRQAPAPRVAVE